MSIPEMDMNPEIARKLLEVGEEFRIEGPFFDAIIKVDTEG